MATSLFAPKMMDLKPFLEKKYAIAGQEADARTQAAKAGMLTAQTGAELNPSRIGLNQANASDANAMAGTRGMTADANAFAARGQGTNALAGARAANEQTDYLEANPDAVRAGLAASQIEDRTKNTGFKDLFNSLFGKSS